MASWTVRFSDKNKYSLTLTATEKSYSVADNTSVVEYKLVMATDAYSYMGFSDHRVTINCSINGTTVYSYNASRDFNPSAASSYSETLCSGTTTVAHNNDGTKTVTCAASVTVASSSYSPGSASISQSLALTTIPRASTASWSGNFVIGSAKTITITRASSNFTHKLTFALGSKTVTPTSSAGTSYSWTPTVSDWAAQFPTQTSRTGTFTLYTYNGSTLIGSNSYSFTMQIPDSWKPSVTIALSPYNTNTFLNSKGVYVAGYTAIRAVATASKVSGDTAAVASYTFSGAFSKTVSTSATSTTQTSGVITTSGSKSVTVTVTDARGRTATATASCSYVSYSSPAVTQIAYARGSYVSDTWADSDTGTDLKITFSASVSLSNIDNNLDWSIGAPVNESGTNLSGSTSVVRYATGIGTTTAYTVVVTVTDDVGNTATRSVYVPTLEIPLVLDVTKPAIGIGAVPQTARTLELASNWFLNAGGGIRLKNLSEIPSETGSRMYPFTATANLVPDSGNTIPTYAKGIFECSGNDSILIAVDYSRNLYIGFRNGATWTVDRYPDSDRSIGTTPNYVKFVNGLMVQWGETSQSATLSQIASSGIYWGTYDITLPTAFSNNYYVVSGVSQYSSGHIVPIGFARRSTTSFRPYIYDFYPRSGSIRVAWQAIGRWK